MAEFPAQAAKTVLSVFLDAYNELHHCACVAKATASLTTATP
jgi:hypothetical protein